MYIMAHRGASGYAPENTMAAFKKGIESMVDSLEIDVRLTKDGKPVICHDATINRTSNGGKLFIHETTYDQLRKFDFGSWYSPDYAKERIPSLEEVLSLVQDNDIDLNIELKNGPVIPHNLEKKVLELVHEYKLEKRTIYSSFDHQSLKRLWTLDNTVKVGIILHMNLINLFDYVDNLDMDIFSIHPNYFYTTEEMIKQAHDRNIKVNVYTLNDIDWAEKYRRMGIDGLITNKLLDFSK